MNSKTKLKLKPIIDILMTFALLLLMSYELLGSTAHEVVGSIVSGVIVSRHLFAFLNIKSTYAANRIHMLSAYWGFVFMSLHLGLHFNMILLMIKKKKQLSPKVKTALSL